VGLKSFSIAMLAKRDCPAPAFANVPAVYEALLDVFAPLDVTLRIDDGDVETIARLDPARVFGTMPLWCDEELARDALTKCKPALGVDVIAELYDRIARAGTVKSLYVSAQGPLFHRVPGTDAPAWYGRWRADSLRELAIASFVWTAEPTRGFELRCPLSGYPFTSTRPLVRGSLADGDPAVAAENRARLFAALAGVRSAIGFDSHEVRWESEGDYGGLYPDDRREIWKRWLPTLNTG
jgi:hypothetical protein